MERVERCLEHSGLPVRSPLTKHTRDAYRRMASIAPSQQPASVPARVAEVTALLARLRRRRDAQAAAMVAAMWGLRCRASDLRRLVAGDCVRAVEPDGAVAWEVSLHEKPATAAAGQRRPPKVLSPGPLAEYFAAWLAVAPRQPGVGLFGPQRAVYRDVLHRVLRAAPSGWRPHAFRRGAAHELELDADLTCDDLRQLLDHASFGTTQLYMASSTVPGRRRLHQQTRRLQPPAMRAALGGAAGRLC
jgi:integrase